MADTDQVSVAARSLAARRWGSQRPVRLAQELAERAAELPEIERRQLIDALRLDVSRMGSHEFGERRQRHHR